MKVKYISKVVLAMFLLVLLDAGCESYNEAVITDLEISREYSPINLKAIIRNSLTIELTWDTKDTDDHYEVEISANDVTFASPIKMSVSASELPLQIKLEGETTYSVRVKAISNRGYDDSKWSVITATTLSEQIFLAVQDGDVLGKEVTARWIANSNATKLVFTPSDTSKPTVTHDITEEEKTNGIATVTGLSSLTKYTVDIFNNTSRRGSQVIETGIDLSDGTEVKPTDDLATMIANAPKDAVLILQPGDYTSQVSTITLTKPITIRGLRSFNKPKLKLTFYVSTTSATDNINLIDLDITGFAGSKIDFLRYTASGSYGGLLVSGCTIHDYDRTFIGASTGINANIKSIIVENSIETNVGTAGKGYFIDFRSAFSYDNKFIKITFNNCVPGAAFFRLDNATVFG